MFKKLIKISRPRFWLYSVGTYSLGMIAATSSLNELLNLQNIIYLFYFALPANIFIYGINDLNDGDTDEFNPKKDDMEYRIQTRDQFWLKVFVYLSLAVGALLAIFYMSFTARLLMLTFLFLAWAYSARPLRFKARPLIDAISNVHYAVIGFTAYAIFTNTLPPLWVITVAWLWTAAMHIFSAVPDIASDSAAGLKTTAVWLGDKTSLLLCSVLWSLVVFIFAYNTPREFLPVTVLLLIYPASSIILYFNPSNIHKDYWWFPYINGMVGFVIFWLIYFSN